jgi:hypothetical protein
MLDRVQIQTLAGQLKDLETCPEATSLQEKEDRARPILIDRAVVEQVESFKFLGVHINNKLEWFKHTKTVVKRARQSLFHPRETKKILHGS